MTSERVLEIFKEITAIPRESGHEEQFTAWLLSRAQSLGLESKRDAAGNVLIVKEASVGREAVPTIVLQAHQDMVCEKNRGCTHDFHRDPIKFVIRDGWMIAEETTLGADDGIGVAACLALLEDEAPKGRIECLFTISEETGMDGAHALEAGFFEGKTLINLDSEDEGQLFIGCSGGLNTSIRFGNIRRVDLAEGWKLVRLSVKGGLGGHSGDEINKGRANAVQELARFLFFELPYGLQLISIDGGGKPNAIARECGAVVALPDEKATAGRFASFGEDLKKEFCATDPGIYTAVEPVSDDNPGPMDQASAENIIRSIFTSPHGIQAMSQSIANLVETSTNLAAVHTVSPSEVQVVTSQRSSMAAHRKMISSKVSAVFKAAGAQTEHLYEYPGWTPDLDSPILKLTRQCYVDLFGEEPEIKAIHAGLECGLFLEKFPGLDMISFGPTLRGVHAPGERLELASMDRFVKLLEEVICRFR